MQRSVSPKRPQNVPAVETALENTIDFSISSVRYRGVQTTYLYYGASQMKMLQVKCSFWRDKLGKYIDFSDSKLGTAMSKTLGGS